MKKMRRSQNILLVLMPMMMLAGCVDKPVENVSTAIENCDEQDCSRSISDVARGGFGSAGNVASSMGS